MSDNLKEQIAQAVREAVARTKDADDAPNAAALIRSGKWDDTTEVRCALLGAEAVIAIPEIAEALKMKPIQTMKVREGR